MLFNANVDRTMTQHIYENMLKNELEIYANEMPDYTRRIILNKISLYVHRLRDNKYASIMHIKIFRIVRLLDFLYLKSTHVRNMSHHTLVDLAVDLLNFFLDGHVKQVPYSIRNIPYVYSLIKNSMYLSPTLYDFIMIHYYIDRQHLSDDDMIKITNMAFEWLETPKGKPSNVASSIISKVKNIKLQIPSLHNDALPLKIFDILELPVNIRTGDKIGKGTYGTVYDIQENKDLVIKKFNHDVELFIEFIHITNLSYKHIIPLVGVTKNGLVYKKQNQTLADYIESNKKVKKNIIRRYMVQLVDALYYLHSNMLAHLDLKPNNIMLDSVNDTIKIIDFGSCRPFNPCLISYNIGCTTYQYAPPETLLTNNKYFTSMRKKFYPKPTVELIITYPAIDIWSLGVCFLYMLTKGNARFFSDKFSVISEIHRLCKVSDWSYIVENITTIEKDFLSLLLKYDPRERANIVKLREHPYIKRCPK